MFSSWEKGSTHLLGRQTTIMKRNITASLDVGLPAIRCRAPLQLDEGGFSAQRSQVPPVQPDAAVRHAPVVVQLRGFARTIPSFIMAYAEGNAAESRAPTSTTRTRPKFSSSPKVTLGILTGKTSPLTSRFRHKHVLISSCHKNHLVHIHVPRISSSKPATKAIGPSDRKLRRLADATMGAGQR